MRETVFATIGLSACLVHFAVGDEAGASFSGNKKENNLVSILVETGSISNVKSSFKFQRPNEGWIFLSVRGKGKGEIRFAIDNSPSGATIKANDASKEQPIETVRYVSQGEHALGVECDGEFRVEKLVVKAIPELMHCGLGFNAAIKSYPVYDMEFLKKDILPNVTTLIVPSNIELPQAVVDDWHGQGKRFVAEVGVNGQAKTSDEHFKYWTGALDRIPFLDGIIINEFGMNNPNPRPSEERMQRAAARHQLYEEAFTRMHADEKYRDKMVYAYFGGSGKKVNYEDTGKTFVRTIMNCNYRIALERYIFEVSSEQKSKDVLQLFVDGIADWEEKEPGVKQKMIIAFGLFSMPPGGINKQPNVDYHVWMDQQMNIVAKHPVMAGMEGLEWWTTLLTDEETVRFVGKLYRHYGIEGKTTMLTHDPLFLPHIQNADFEQGIEGWTLQSAEEGSIQPKSFPRYGRIEGRYMGLGRPADPEHIGDTFLLMKRSEKGPNTFSQTIKDLEPGRLYSMKMFSCDYNDLTHPQKKDVAEANKFVGKVVLEGLDVDEKRSFTEMYPSGPEPKIPVWITYFWKVFRAKGTTAKLTVSDWESDKPSGPFGQEQTFNFVEIEPYHE
jgi:hypothetical protein